MRLPAVESARGNGIGVFALVENDDVLLLIRSHREKSWESFRNGTQRHVVFFFYSSIVRTANLELQSIAGLKAELGRHLLALQ